MTDRSSTAHHETSRTAALFISHGSPMVALEDDDYNGALARAAAGVAKPAAIVVVSAHWEAALPVRVTSSVRPRTIHDFGGFPDELYRLTYQAPGSPSLATEVMSLLSARGIAAIADAQRGLDHGVWVPLRFLYPEADIPVVAVSLSVPRSPSELLAIGSALASLREQGVMLIGSGGIVHNLRRVVFADKHARVDAWAREFDDWFRGRLHERDVDAIASYRELAPNADLAVPTSEHFDPLFVMLGCWAEDERAIDVYEGFHHGNLSMRSWMLKHG